MSVPSSISAFRSLEHRRNSRVIGLIHRQETMVLLGFPIARYIDTPGVTRQRRL
jgi:hypothetical protein